MIISSLVISILSKKIGFWTRITTPLLLQFDHSQNYFSGSSLATCSNFQNFDRASFGCLLRTREGLWINEFSGYVGDYNNTLVELTAILHGLKIAWVKILGLFSTHIPYTLLTLLLMPIFIFTVMQLRSYLSEIY